MTLTITLTQFKKKPKKVVLELPDGLPLSTIRRLWETEQFLNSLGNLRVHVGVSE